MILRRKIWRGSGSGGALDLGGGLGRGMALARGGALGFAMRLGCGSEIVSDCSDAAGESESDIEMRWGETVSNCSDAPGENEFDLGEMVASDSEAGGSGALR